MEKTYQITESELLALLKEQREICMNVDEQYWRNGVGDADGYSHLLNAPTPDLSNLKEVEQVVGGIDWEGNQAEVRTLISEIIHKELEPLLIGGCAYTHVIHQGKATPLAETIRTAVGEWLKTNLHKYSTAVNEDWKEGYNEKHKGWVALYKDEDEFNQYLKWKYSTAVSVNH